MIIGLLALLSFILPAASGERLALSVTLLLALIFFLLNATSMIPKDNVSIPIIYQFFIATLTQTVSLIVILIFSLQLYYKKAYDPAMSRWVRRVILDSLSYVVGVRTARQEIYSVKAEDIESIIEIGYTYTGSNVDINSSISTRRLGELSGKRCNLQSQQIMKEWRVVALTVDRCLFLLFTFTWCLTIFTFFVKVSAR